MSKPRLIVRIAEQAENKIVRSNTNERKALREPLVTKVSEECQTIVQQVLDALIHIKKFYKDRQPLPQEIDKEIVRLHFKYSELPTGEMITNIVHSWQQSNRECSNYSRATIREAVAYIISRKAREQELSR